MAKFVPNFDDAVERALAKWPNVPHCFDWLHLDRRGQWLIKGEPIQHIRTVEFISRHYCSDEHGRWYVQNGPQRVYCSLDYTPLIFHLTADSSLVAHTQHTCSVINEILLDDHGNILALTDLGLGLIDDRDLIKLSTDMESSIGDAWLDFEHVFNLTRKGEKLQIRLGLHNISLNVVFADTVARKFGFEPQPKALTCELTAD